MIYCTWFVWGKRHGFYILTLVPLYQLFILNIYTSHIMQNITLFIFDERDLVIELKILMKMP